MANVEQNRGRDARARATSWVLCAVKRYGNVDHAGIVARLAGFTPQGARTYTVRRLHRPTFHRTEVECYEVTCEQRDREGRNLSACTVAPACPSVGAAVERATWHFENEARAWRARFERVEHKSALVALCGTCRGCGSFMGARCSECAGSGWAVAS